MLYCIIVFHECSQFLLNNRQKEMVVYVMYHQQVFLVYSIHFFKTCLNHVNPVEL